MAPLFIMRTPKQVDNLVVQLWTWIERPRRILYRWVYGPQFADKMLPIEMKTLRGHLALDTFSVVRILGWTNQYEEDIYWIVLTRLPGEGVSVQLISACGGFIPLYRRLRSYDYWQTVRLWDMNDATVEHGLEICKERGILVL